MLDRHSLQNQIDSRFVSVIIPVFNDCDRLELCLSALEQQTYPKELYEVVVVNNNSDEDIERVTGQFNQVVTVFESRRGSYAARNKGISIAKGKILAFTDADCIPVKTWLETGIKHLFSVPNCGLVAGHIQFFFKDPCRPTAVELFDSMTNLQQEKYVKENNFGATANLFTFKKIFEHIGYFNADLKSGGDVEWGVRVSAQGYSLDYEEESYVAHPARYSLKQLAKKIIRQTGGSYDYHKDNIPKSTRLVKSFYELKPPLRSAFRKAFLEWELKSAEQRFKLFFVIIFAHYVKRIEEIRLLLGGKSSG